MPKPKPTSVLVHRLDLQPSVKDSLDSFLIGKTVTNTLQGIGSIVNGFGPALGAIAVWYLADRTLDEVVDKASDYFRRKGKEIADERYDPQLQHYKLVMATLESCANNDDFKAQYDGVIKIIKGPGNFNPVFDAFVRFKNKIKLDPQIWTDPAMWGRPMAKRWKAYYPLKALTQEIKNDTLSGFGQADKMPWLRWLGSVVSR